MTQSHRNYVLILSFLFAVTLGPIFVFNLFLANNTLGNNQKILAASEWQQTTRGVTYAPPLGNDRLFKILRLIDQLPNINTVIFGSSTVMGITANMFPPHMHAFNFSQSGHPTYLTIGEAEYLLDHAEHIKWMIIPLDWSLGHIYLTQEPATVDLTPSAVRRDIFEGKVSWSDKMRDAMSYPRIVSLFKIFGSISRSKDRVIAFKRYFIRDASEEYHCPDGTLAIDFDTIFRGICAGFRYDGSGTFTNNTHVTNADQLIQEAQNPDTVYVNSLALTGGVPNSQYLQRISRIGRRLEQRGGALILLQPPLLTGMESAFLKNPKLSKSVLMTKDTLLDWSNREKLLMLDLGQSERFGCVATEFMDQHHAFKECYEKIMSSFFSSNPTVGKR